DEEKRGIVALFFPSRHCRKSDNEALICRHFGMCGGGSLQHRSYSQHLTSKETALLERLRGVLPKVLREPQGPVAFPLFLPVHDEDMPRAFRQKVAFVFG